MLVNLSFFIIFFEHFNLAWRFKCFNNIDAKLLNEFETWYTDSLGILYKLYPGWTERKLQLYFFINKEQKKEMKTKMLELYLKTKIASFFILQRVVVYMVTYFYALSFIVR